MMLYTVIICTVVVMVTILTHTVIFSLMPVSRLQIDVYPVPGRGVGLVGMNMLKIVEMNQCFGILCGYNVVALQSVLWLI